MKGTCEAPSRLRLGVPPPGCPTAPLPAVASQGWYGNTSSLLQGVVQTRPDGQLVMDFLSSGEDLFEGQS